MHDAIPPDDDPTPDADGLSVGTGIWGLDLWNGSAWFNEWFIERLKWSGHERKRLDDLRPHLPGGAWEMLLAAIRNHLERQAPLDLTLCAKLDGRAEWWRIQGVAEHNAAGQPVYLSGSACDVAHVRREGAEFDEP